MDSGFQPGGKGVGSYSSANEREPRPVQESTVRDQVRTRQLTVNELAWVEFILLISRDADPAPTLRRVQMLRMLLTAKE